MLKNRGKQLKRTWKILRQANDQIDAWDCEGLKEG